MAQKREAQRRVAGKAQVEAQVFVRTQQRHVRFPFVDAVEDRGVLSFRCLRGHGLRHAGAVEQHRPVRRAPLAADGNAQAAIRIKHDPIGAVQFFPTPSHGVAQLNAVARHRDGFTLGADGKLADLLA